VRLHRLRLNAFGPFPGAEEVDFDALSEAGLFLLRGETGAGKTSVLDAVCFALYGTLPGVRAGSEKGVRSHYAPDGAAPEVELEFSVRERRFRITRTPEWQRPKKRGEGFTKANASVALAEWDGRDYAPLSARLDEAGQQISTVLGMDVHQFTRVAMLPQGEFAAFLRSDDKNRESLLKRLFDTRVFDRTTAAAAEHRRVSELAAGEKGQSRATLAEDANRHARERLGAGAVDEALEGALGGALEDAGHGTPDGVPDGHDDAGPAPAPTPASGGVATTGPAAEPAAGPAPVEATTAGAAAELAAEAASAPTPEAGDAAWFDAVVGLAGSREGLALAAAEAGDARAKAAAMELAAVRSRADDARELEAYELRAAELAAGSEAAAADRARLDSHRRALAVRSELDAQAAAEARGEQARLRAAAAAERLTRVPARTLAGEAQDEAAWAELVSGLGLATSAGAGTLPAPGAAGAGSREPSGATAAPADVPGLEERLLTWVRTAEALEDRAAQALKAEERAAGLHLAATAARAQSERAAAAVQRATTELTEAKDAAESARSAAAALPEQPGALEAARERVLEAQRVLRAAQLALSSRAAEARASERERELDTARTAAREAAYGLRVRREAAMAAILAAGLTADAPCPVCGALEHPEPARAEALEEVSPEAIAAADRAVAAAEGHHAEALAAHEAARALLGEHAVSAGGLDPEAAGALLEAAEGAEADAKARAAHRERALESERAGAQALREAELALQAATAEHERRVQEAGAAEETAARSEAEHEGAAAGHADVAARRAAVAELARAIDAAATSYGGWREALGEARSAAERASVRLSEAGLSAGEAIEAVLAPEPAQALAAAVSARLAREAALAEAAASAPVERARAAREAGREAPTAAELERAAEAAAGAAEERDTLAAQATLAADLRVDLEGRRAVIERLDRELGPLASRAKVAKAIAELTSGNGENRLNMSLSTYVLAARLEAVAEAATLRLDAMSDGRYRLVHVDEKRGNRRSGLGLAVEDAWTGSRRAPETLSGGETFMASLALALGLADVVQEEAGGVDVETLFVDEGFGTLDPETLELVLDGLDQLRRGGRLVGVVSHVAELGQRIGAQVRVDKTRHGSSLRLVGVGSGADATAVDDAPVTLGDED
jgi:exonuclease SbcC